MTYKSKLLDQALDLAKAGYYVFPCNPSKGPGRGQSFKSATDDPAKVKKLFSKNGVGLIGIACEKSGIWAVDIDNKNGYKGEEIFAELLNSHGGDLPDCPTQSTPNKGEHLLFRYPENVKINQAANQLGPGVDTRSAGHICTGAGYTWIDGLSLYDLEPPAAPSWLVSLAAKTVDQETITPSDKKRKKPAGDAGDSWLAKAISRSGGNRNDTGLWLACQLRDDGFSQVEAENIMRSYAGQVTTASDHPYELSEALASLKSAYSRAARDPATGKGGTVTKRSFDDLTDTGNAKRLKIKYGDRLRWVKEWGWLWYDGKRWIIDDLQKRVIYAKNIGRDIAIEATKASGPGQEEYARKLFQLSHKTLNSGGIKSMLDVAESELPATTKQFDKHKYWFSVQNGVIDLQTGAIAKHRPKQYITKLSGATFDPSAICPRWTLFLSEIFEGNQELIDFIQRSIGYTLTGDTGAQCFFFLYGMGANGKSTFTRIIQDLLGDYSMKTRAETLMRERNSSIPEEVAQLAGVRFMLAAELGEGQRLNEGLVKDLTGGDMLRARRLYHNSFEFVPFCKAWIYGNHKPTISGTDEGIWRRVKMIPFKVTFSEDDRDPNLIEKLQGELSGILNWALEGCAEYMKNGLQTPAIVEAETEEYRKDQDILGGFLSDCCVEDPAISVTSKDLYDVYKDWADENGLYGLSKIRFSRQMGERGFSTSGQRDSSGRALYIGLGLNDDRKNDASWSNILKG